VEACRKRFLDALKWHADHDRPEEAVLFISLVSAIALDESTQAPIRYVPAARSRGTANLMLTIADARGFKLSLTAPPEVGAISSSVVARFRPRMRRQ